MAVRYYPAILERTADGLAVSFRDFPGLATHGETMEEAAAEAEAALALHIAGMAEDGDPIPEPTPIELIGRDPEVKEAGRLLVRADLPGKSLRLNITMEEGLVNAIDAEAKRRDTSRSGFLALAARKELAQAARP